MLDGIVTASIFKGDYYLLEVRSGDYEFDVQETNGWDVGTPVKLFIGPNDIHIMKNLRIINTFDATVTDENTVEFCGGEFEFVGGGYEKGDTVRVSVPFDKVELTDDDSDGVIGANVTQTVYKGSYYQTQVYTDTDEDFFVDTPIEWDIGDRVGIRIAPADLILERVEQDGEDEQ